LVATALKMRWRISTAREESSSNESFRRSPGVRIESSRPIAQTSKATAERVVSAVRPHQFTIAERTDRSAIFVAFLAGFVSRREPESHDPHSNGTVTTSKMDKT
jgi:hypothetical protein